ncbi:tRNA-intron lyase [Halovenus marina]|uniref:tRNA-intron lyase n=1 Tax=Halovenus marina TaxID=3396621 RepID=UPI003F57FDDC
MECTFDGDRVRAGTDAREQFYDSRGYGRPHNGALELAPVEAAHLLYRGDIERVRDERPETAQYLDFESLLDTVVRAVDFFVYRELRDRGFYLSPVREGWVDDIDQFAEADFVVYPRGEGPWDDTVAYRVRVASERESIPADSLLALATGDPTGVLAVVDEESEVTYFECDRPTMTGSSHHDLSATSGTLLEDRVLVETPPDALHERAFYGQPLDHEDDALQLSLIEATHLAGRGLLSVEGGELALLERGRTVEGDRFDRRLAVYDALRTAGIVPKTGFKFGADFRTYAHVESVDDLGHSERLVRVCPADHVFDPRDLALDVRLAGGVRKQLVCALVADDDIDWLSVGRLTP